MKFSDMMGKGEPTTTEEVDTDTTTAPASTPAPPPPPDASVRFNDQRVRREDDTTPPPPPAGRPESSSTLMMDVVNELKPGRETAPVASTQQLDASAWLDGLGGIDDDLLPS